MFFVVGGLFASLLIPHGAVPGLLVSSGAAVFKAIRHRKKHSISGAGEKLSELPSDVVLEWHSVSCKLGSSKRKGEVKTILDGVSGVARPGRVLAILGPSGSGKTTLLNVLAGRLPYSKHITLKGSVLCNGLSINNSSHEVAYVTQEDLFFSQLTVQETLDLAARMRLPRDLSTAERKAFVSNLIRRLGLATTVNTNVGDAATRGISGGERKRLSLGCELISTPQLILCDEPTSGLDAFQAQKVMETLRELASAGHTVICSIHQPSSIIFNMFDDILLLSSGQVAYFGPRKESQSYFKKLGFDTPPFCNPAEIFLDLISVNNTSPRTAELSQQRISSLIEAFKKHRVNDIATRYVSEGGGKCTPYTKSMEKTSRPSALGPFGQFLALLRRAWRQATRDKKTNISRFMSSFWSALLFGAIYWKMGLSQSTIQNRLGLLQVCTINAAMTSLVKTLNVFPKEAVLVNRERSKGSYGVLPYFMSKICAELPLASFFPLMFSSIVYPMAGLSGGLQRILKFTSIVTLDSFAAASYGLVVGALVPNTETALAIGPPTFILQIVFGGTYLTEDSVPGWASWIPRVSLIKHTFEALCVNELRGLEFETSRQSDVRNGQEVLERLTWGDSTVVKSLQRVSRIIAFNYLATYTILSLKKPRFEKVLPRDASDAPEIMEVVSEQEATDEINSRPVTNQALL